MRRLVLLRLVTSLPLAKKSRTSKVWIGTPSFLFEKKKEKKEKEKGERKRRKRKEKKKRKKRKRKKRKRKKMA